jgi:hypothetical protein
MKSDRRGIVTIRGRHRYATDPANAGREVIVGFRALEVEILDARGSHIAAHPRAYGDMPTSSEDPSRQLELLGNRPGAWPNGQVGQALPDPLREWLDRQEKTVLREGLHTLKHADRDHGWQNAVTAMLQILETTGTTNRAGGELDTARLAAGTRAVDYDEPVDLTEYDQAFATKKQA